MTTGQFVVVGDDDLARVKRASTWRFCLLYARMANRRRKKKDTKYAVIEPMVQLLGRSEKSKLRPKG